MKRKKKFDPRNLALLLFSILCSLGILEIALRILFSSNQSFLVDAHRDVPFITKNPYWKVWHYTDATCNHNSTCFDATYHTNALGLKGPELRDSSKYRIALIGDSYVEGYGKSNHQIFPHFLDSLTGEEVEILNFGTSGGFGTVNEVALYENFARHFKPDLVILFYLNYNDVHDNLNAISNGRIDKDMNLTYKVGTKEEVFASVSANIQPAPTSAVISGLYVLELAGKGWSALEVFAQNALNMKMDFHSGLADIYAEEDVDYLQPGYDAVGASLKRFIELTSADSAKFVVINFPDPFQVDDNWIAMTEFKKDITLNPTKPNKIIRNICKELDVAYYDMYPNAKAHIDKNEMEFPYLSHTCDRHPSTIGHRYLANDIYQFLNTNKYLNF
ncbi:MAG: SGNH/GDSL hydrolase family protein [Cyclobacteriaceae bacterium]